MTRHARTTILALLCLTAPLTACGEDHTEGVAPATVAPTTPSTPTTQAPTTPEATPTSAAGTTAPSTDQAPPDTVSLPIARDRSTLGFTAAKVTASHDGSFGEWSGTIDLARSGDPTASRENVSIVMDSLVIEPARLAGHLRTPDLLDVARFPTATFRSTQIAAGATGQVGDAAATHTVTGDFTLHGQTRAITFPAIITVTDGEVSARAEFSINRQDFGITYPGMPDDLIRDEVVIRFDIHAPRT
jgi:polyisoprenoid-binding protein YceI